MGGIFRALFKWTGIGALFTVGGSLASGTISAGPSISNIILTALIIGASILGIWALFKFVK